MRNENTVMLDQLAFLMTSVMRREADQKTKESKGENNAERAQTED